MTVEVQVSLDRFKFDSHILKKGTRFGKLVTLYKIGIHNDRVQWKCICDCGNERRVSRLDLLNGIKVQCRDCNIKIKIEKYVK